MPIKGSFCPFFKHFQDENSSALKIETEHNVKAVKLDNIFGI